MQVVLLSARLSMISAACRRAESWLGEETGLEYASPEFASTQVLVFLKSYGTDSRKHSNASAHTHTQTPAFLAADVICNDGQIPADSVTRGQSFSHWAE